MVYVQSDNGIITMLYSNRMATPQEIEAVEIYSGRKLGVCWHCLPYREGQEERCILPPATGLETLTVKVKDGTVRYFVVDRNVYQ